MVSVLTVSKRHLTVNLPNVNTANIGRRKTRYGQCRPCNSVAESYPAPSDDHDVFDATLTRITDHINGVLGIADKQAGIVTDSVVGDLWVPSAFRFLLRQLASHFISHNILLADTSSSRLTCWDGLMLSAPPSSPVHHPNWLCSIVDFYHGLL